MKQQSYKKLAILFKILLTGMLVLPSIGVKAQYIPSPAVLDQPATVAGNYYNETSIILKPGFSATATSTKSFSYTAKYTDCMVLGTNLSQNKNYILTSVSRDSTVTNLSSGTNSNCQVMQTVQYIDGIGRPIQTIQIKGSYNSKDVIQPVAYDQFGRESTKYLPYVQVNGVSDGSYKTDALTTGAGQASFYANPPSGVATINYPSASSAYESSPLNRVVEQGAPGAPWQLSTSGVTGSGHTIKIIYGTNAANEVVMWSVNSTGTGATGGNTYYPSGQLDLTKTTDENGYSTIEYKDKEGHVVCKKNQSTSSPDAYLSTYYIYDDLDNLSYVIPPLPSGVAYPTSFTESSSVYLKYMYGYDYDGRHRIITKKIPGKDIEEMVYNLLDQVIFSRDANQKALSQWAFTKYDVQGRVIMTGVEYANTYERPDLQDYVTDQLQQGLFAEWETRSSTGVQGYTNAAFPNSTNVKPMLVNYYDNYSFPGKPSTFVTPAGISSMTNGLLTGTKTMVLNTVDNATPTMLWTVSFYDDFGRVTQSYAQHYRGGTVSAYNYDQYTNVYDFTNELTSSTRQHYTKNSGNTAAVLGATVVNNYVYDHLGRKTQTFEQIDDGPNVLLAKNDFNEADQLMVKHLHGSTPTAAFLQDIGYAYNERGWLSKINNPGADVSSKKLFAEQLSYNVPVHGAKAQYNGNIAEQVYNATVSGNQYVTYSYDPLNRLTDGVSSEGYTEKDISYDELGNITSLKRGSAPAYAYNYDGNHLTSVTGLTGSSYTYDGNGNMKHDGRNNNDIVYNTLNLPQTISGSDAITYVYAADGTKLRKLSTTNTDYIDGIQYKDDGTIDFIQTEEGRAVKNGDTYVYEYTLTDHLGNNRVTFNQADGQVGEDDYYPFGKDANRLANPGNKYLYNGKEQQTELGTYDYGFRQYDPVIARWNVPDPDAENYESTSSYAYVLNNPINLGDVDGRDTIHLKEVLIHATKPAPKPEPIEIEPLKEIKPIELGVFIKPPVFLMPILTLVFVLMPANYGEHGEADALKLMNARRDPKHPGSYTIKFKNGKRYHGKGSFARALQSAKRIARDHETSFEISDIDWTPSTSNEQSFRDEAKRLENDGGKDNPNNYNERDSPGSHKYKQDQ